MGKSNAQWWYDGIITDEEFTKSIEFMIEGVTVTVDSDDTFETTVDDLDEKSEGLDYEGEEGKYGIIVKVVDDSGATISSEDFDFEVESNDEPESSVESTTHEISVLMISGGYFPIAQFSTWQWVGECSDANHYHSNTGHAILTTLQTLGDPVPNECSYGKISEIPKSIINMSDERCSRLY